MMRKKPDLMTALSSPPPTPAPEEQIMRTWKGVNSSPVVTVLCHVYNHEKVIAQALNGILMQQTDFPFEVIVHDDASDDGTRDILVEYQRHYPRILNLLLQDDNQFVKGNKPSKFTFPQVRGEYIAFCEGDDYWTDPEKIAKQVRALEGHGHVDLCFHSALRLDVNRGSLSCICQHAKTLSHVEAKAIMNGGGAFCPSASLMFRRAVLKKTGSWFDEAPVGDLFIQALAAERGGAIFLPEPMSVYRSGGEGSWSRMIIRQDLLDAYADKMHKAMTSLEHVIDPVYQACLIRYRARLDYFLAVRYLKIGKPADFQHCIVKSWSRLAFLSKGQAVLYWFRWNMPLCRLLVKNYI